MTPDSDPVASGMDFNGHEAQARIRRGAGNVWEVYDAGESEGVSAGTFIVGWGSLVRCAAPRVH